MPWHKWHFRQGQKHLSRCHGVWMTSTMYSLRRGYYLQYMGHIVPFATGVVHRVQYAVSNWATRCWLPVTHQLTLFFVSSMPWCLGCNCQGNIDNFSRVIFYLLNAMGIEVDWLAIYSVGSQFCFICTVANKCDNALALCMKYGRINNICSMPWQKQYCLGAMALTHFLGRAICFGAPVEWWNVILRNTSFVLRPINCFVPGQYPQKCGRVKIIDCMAMAIKLY